MTSQNMQMIIMPHDTYTGTANTSDDNWDVKDFSSLMLVWRVTQGTATASHVATLYFETCDIDSSDDNDWATMSPYSGTIAAVNGTGGANPWPVVQCATYITHNRYVRVRTTHSVSGSWSYGVVVIGRNTN